MDSTLGIPGGVTGAVPSGTIVMFHGSTIPTGWSLCDGSNGTPDLRDRFIVGAGHDYSLGATGGSEEVALTTAQMPSHSHSITGGSHSHTISGGGHTHEVDSSKSVTAQMQACRNVPVTSAGSYIFGVTEKTNYSSSGTLDVTINSLALTVSPATPTMTCGNASPSMSVSNSGGGGSHENRPPYYALYFIMKL